MSEGIIRTMERFNTISERVAARMSYEKAKGLLELARAYGWNKESIDSQTEVVAQRKRDLEALEAL